MPLDENKTVVRRFFEELWNNRDVQIADEIFAADCITHQLQSGEDPVAARRDPETLKKHVAEWLAGFPDLRFAVEQMIAEEDRVVTQCVMRGTHTGTWLGIAPTNKHVSIRMIVIHRVSDGKIVEDWVLVESLGFFQQLGLTPSAGEIMSKAAE
jgi:steroid delta-isomerase-like uncharacterized protein